ncbi:hypothetical protein E2C01_025331 [Portunus trituberculatus]|uniref:Uncharacterized protein n=1 Tax=Portunus trituberculatus TaxID=210409 RepID=A0A5B7EFH7_PORTR|nr:hypothetical protein [Portunus trituberculatus]
MLPLLLLLLLVLLLLLFLCVWPIAPVGNLKSIGSTVKLPPISGAGNFIYSGTHIKGPYNHQSVSLV